MKRKKLKVETGDLLRLCHTVPLEVVSLGGLHLLSLKHSGILDERLHFTQKSYNVSDTFSGTKAALLLYYIPLKTATVDQSAIESKHSKS